MKASISFLRDEKKRRRGFSLIEAAIVLGIVGLVIGGIWVATAAVKNRMAIRNALDLVFFLQEKSMAFRASVMNVVIPDGCPPGSDPDCVSSAPDSDLQYSIGPLLTGQGAPGGYVYDSANDIFSNGRQHGWFQIWRFEKKPYFMGYIVLNANDVLNGPYATKPDLCIALSNELMNTKRVGRVYWPHAPMVIQPYYSLMWLADGESWSGAGNFWNGGSAPKTQQEISTICQNTTSFSFMWAL